MQKEFLNDLYEKSNNHKLVVVEFSHTYQFVNEIYDFLKEKKKATYIDSYFFFTNRLFIPTNWKELCNNNEYLIIDGIFWSREFITSRIEAIIKEYNINVIWVWQYKMPFQINVDSKISITPPFFTYNDFLKLNPKSSLKIYSEDGSPMLRFLKKMSIREKVWYLEEVGNGFYFKSLTNDGNLIRNVPTYTFILNYMLNMIKDNSYVSWLTFKAYNKRTYNIKCSFNVFTRCLSILTSLGLFKQFDSLNIGSQKQLYIPNDWNVFYVSSDINSLENPTMQPIYNTILLTHLYYADYKITFIKEHAFFSIDNKNFVTLITKNTDVDEVVRLFAKNYKGQLQIIQSNTTNKHTKCPNNAIYTTVEQFLTKM